MCVCVFNSTDGQLSGQPEKRLYLRIMSSQDIFTKKKKDTGTISYLTCTGGRCTYKPQPFAENYQRRAVLAGAQSQPAPEMTARHSQPPPVRLGSSYSKQQGGPRHGIAPAVLQDGHFTPSLGGSKFIAF